MKGIISYHMNNPSRVLKPPKRTILLPQAQIDQHNARIKGIKSGGVSRALVSSRRVPRDAFDRAFYKWKLVRF